MGLRFQALPCKYEQGKYRLLIWDFLVGGILGVVFGQYFCRSSLQQHLGNNISRVPQQSCWLYTLIALQQQKVLSKWKLVDLKMLDFIDRIIYSFTQAR